MPELTKEQLYIILGVIFVVLIGCVVGVYNQKSCQNQSSPVSSPPAILAGNAAKNEDIPIFVHISGAVDREGVYKLNKTDRLIDLLRLSGIAKDADLDSINLVEPINDGQRVFVPQKITNANIEREGGKVVRSLSSGKKININRADEKELDGLPGIGPTLAKRIVEHRNEKGRFSNINELKNVQGVTNKKFENLKDRISVL